MNMNERNLFENNYLQSANINLIDSQGNSTPKEVLLIKEISLKIYLKSENENSHITTVLCLNDRLDELVVGILFDKKIINKYEDIDSINYITDHDTTNVYVILSKGVVPRESQNENAKLMQNTYEKNHIFELINIFNADTALHLSTKATHSCMLSDNEKLLIQVEDTGRHNSIDKVIGYTLINHLLPSKLMIFTSARISAQMVQKAVAVQIPIIISKSVPTAEAFNLAKESGLTLLFNARNDSFCESI